MNLTRYNTLQIKQIKMYSHNLEEREHHPVSLEDAAMDWSVHEDPVTHTTRAEQFHDQVEAHEHTLDLMCAYYCNSACKGYENCPFAEQYLNNILQGDNMKPSPKIEDMCTNYFVSRLHRKHEEDRGDGTTGTMGYEKTGCYSCNGCKTGCKAYMNFPSMNVKANKELNEETK